MNTVKLFIIGFSFLVLNAFINKEAVIYSSNTGNISFFSHTSVEDIKADNHKVKTAFDANSGKIQYSVLIKDFEFEKALMQEHFNENYMESNTYPKSTFNGTIDDISAIKFDMDGTYTSKVSGKLTIKDVTKDINTQATFTVKGNVVHAKTKFNLNPEDYNIDIPRIVSNKISRDIEVSVNIDYKSKP